jgi:phosphosulfolactate phosphohydrolase-like enzyme
MEKTVTIDCSPESLAYYRDGYAIVAVEVMRATTAVAALNRRCFPELLSRRRFPSLEGLTITLLVGKLGGSMPNGFDLTNGPAELGLWSDVYHPMMLLSPSGTKVLCEAKGSDAVYAACLQNYGAQVCFLAASPLIVWSVHSGV